MRKRAWATCFPACGQTCHGGSQFTLVTPGIQRPNAPNLVGALYELARLDVAEGMSHWDDPTACVRLNGTPVEHELFGQVWRISYQDVRGLVDLYAGSPVLLAALGVDVEALELALEALREEWRLRGRPLDRAVFWVLVLRAVCLRIWIRLWRF